MPAAHVQHKGAHPAFDSASTTIAATFDSAVSTDGFVVGMVTNKEDEATVSSVTDDKSNSYTVEQTCVTTANVRTTTFWATNLDNGPATVTVNFSGSTQFRSLIVHEASGIDTSSPLDQKTSSVQASPGTGSDGVSSGTVTTTTDGQYIFGASAVTNALPASPVFSPGQGFTESTEAGADGTKIDLAAEYLIQSVQGTCAATFTLASNNPVNTQILTFKAATGGGGGSWGALLSDRLNRLVRA